MKLNLVKIRKEKPDFSNLGFGKYFTDHMLVWEYDSESGWGEMEIRKFENLPISPACCSLHYGQGIFEGLKAYKCEDGSIKMFRSLDNFKRMNNSGSQQILAQHYIFVHLCMEVKIFLECIHQKNIHFV